MSNRQTLKFEVVGSTGVIYDVSAVHDGTNVSMFCTCDAAKNGTACKHRLAILGGDTAGVRSGGDQIATLCNVWLPGTPLERALTEVKNAEREADEAKRQMASKKKALARIMTQV